MNNQMITENLSVVVHNGIPVITTELLAKLYETDSVRIRQNHHENKQRFVEGKHYFKVIGDELRDLRVALNYLQISPKTRSLILWTERGAARHAKMLETDQAWEVFEQLEDCYFNTERANNPPQYQPESHELFTANDTSNLARLIWHMSHNFRFKQAWSNGIWYALREVTGIASPQPMEVRHIPHIARECERIWAVIERLQSAMIEAERRTIRQLVRKRENVDSVMGEIDSLLIEASQSNAFMLTDTLTRWHKSELGQFAQRH
ncbi:ORF6N domain-containing protein [Sodalis endosymbiont of Spalangia cameroni]|uniref:ORF6N domain-containing protein n=1 Tax=Sodalis praecaptivus TaxID=1239307 RepID=UPI0031F87736